MATVEAHGFAQHSHQASIEKYGFKITVGGADITLTKITSDPDSTATKAHVLDSSKSLLDTQDFVGHDATFDYTLTASTTYYFVTDKEGNSYTSQQYGPGSFPVAGTYLNWIAGLLGDDNPDWGRDVESVTVEEAVTATRWQVNVDDALKEVAAIKVNVDDVEKEGAAALVNKDDAWKEVF